MTHARPACQGVPCRTIAPAARCRISSEQSTHGQNSRHEIRRSAYCGRGFCSANITWCSPNSTKWSASVQLSSRSSETLRCVGLLGHRDEPRQVAEDGEHPLGQGRRGLAGVALALVLGQEAERHLEVAAAVEAEQQEADDDTVALDGDAALGADLVAALVGLVLVDRPAEVSAQRLLDEGASVRRPVGVRCRPAGPAGWSRSGRAGTTDE